MKRGRLEDFMFAKNDSTSGCFFSTWSSFCAQYRGRIVCPICGSSWPSEAPEMECSCPPWPPKDIELDPLRGVSLDSDFDVELEFDLVDDWSAP